MRYLASRLATYFILVLMAVVVGVAAGPANIARAQPATVQLTVQTQATNGSSLAGFYTVLNQSETIVAAGYTPYTFNLTSGENYTVQVDNYGACTFDDWANSGNPSFYQNVSITSDTDLLAIMNCSGQTQSNQYGGVTVEAVDQNGNTVTGAEILLCSSGTSGLANGFNDCEDRGNGFLSSAGTPASFGGLPNGATFGVEALNTYDCYFSHWSGRPDDQGWPYRLTLFNAQNPPAVLTAAYDCVSSTSSSRLTVTAQDVNGGQITNFLAVLNQSSIVLGVYTTPVTLNLADGPTYSVGVSGGVLNSSCRFEHWLDTGNATAVRQISITNSTQITAVFDCPSTTTTSTSSSYSSYTSTTNTTTNSSTTYSSSTTTNTTYSQSTTSQMTRAITSSSVSSPSTTITTTTVPTTQSSTSSIPSSSAITSKSSSADAQASMSVLSSGTILGMSVAIAVIAAAGFALLPRRKRNEP